VFVLTNEQVEADARRSAGWLRSQGLAPGDRVAVVAANVPWYVPFVLGALRSGVVPVPVNIHLSADEKTRVIGDADVALVVDREPGAGLAVDLAPMPLARPMHFTSGTTGLAKGVWSGLLDESAARALLADELELWGAEPDETYLVCSPLYHSAPLRIAISALLAGARVIVFERFNEVEIARAFSDERVNGAFLVPTHLRRLLAGEFDATYARRILHAGEACPDELKRRAIDVFGADRLHEFYGSTEGQFTLCSSEEWLERPGTVGRARTGRTLDIRDGAIWVTAPSFARWEYWRDPEKTSQAWRGPSFTVGDLGRLDDEGYLFIEGRREDLIISGGVNVYPAEVERVLVQHPDVIEAAVFGIADGEFGQRVCAAVTGGADAESVRLFARERLPGSHAPKSVFVTDELPRTASGKIKRQELRGQVQP
jgi:long-chain acyl-CoA synthetase